MDRMGGRNVARRGVTARMPRMGVMCGMSLRRGRGRRGVIVTVARRFGRRMVMRRLPAKGRDKPRGEPAAEIIGVEGGGKRAFMQDMVDFGADGASGRGADIGERQNIVRRCGHKITVGGLLRGFKAEIGPRRGARRGDKGDKPRAGADFGRAAPALGAEAIDQEHHIGRGNAGNAGNAGHEAPRMNRADAAAGSQSYARELADPLAPVPQFRKPR